MSNPLVHAFFIGRAVAETLGEHLERSLTNTLSELGKFDAEQREALRQFTEEVLERARRAEEATLRSRTTTVGAEGAPPTDLQATIDDLRAEMAQLRSELQKYRSRAA